MPHPCVQSPTVPGPVPTIQPGAQHLPVPARSGCHIWVTMARRERREDAQHWGCAASLPLGAQPPHQPGPLPQGCPCLPALGPSEKLGTMVWWLAPVRLSPLALALPSLPAPLPLCCLRPLCCVFHGSQAGRSRGHLVPLTHAYRTPEMMAQLTQIKSGSCPPWVEQLRVRKQEVALVREHGGSPFHPLHSSWAPSQVSLGFMVHPLPKTIQSCCSPSSRLSILRKLWFSHISMRTLQHASEAASRWLRSNFNKSQGRQQE